MFGPAQPISPAEMSVSTPEASTPESATESEPARTPLGEDQLRELVASLGDLPSLPDIALRAMRLAEDPDWDLKKLEQTIRRDQGLAARFLRLANSAFFGARCTITTLDRAINLVGITRVQSVLLAAGLEGLHQSKKSNFKGRILWEHALAVACMSQHLAKQSGIGDPEEAFMAGLLHDIGRPIMDDVFHDKYGEAIALVEDGSAASLLSAEQRIFKFDHTDVGYVVVSAWGFPPHIGQAIRFHHDPTMAENATDLCAVVSLANSMCARLQLGPDQQPDLDLEALASTKLLGLEGRTEALFEQMPQLVAEASLL